MQPRVDEREAHKAFRPGDRVKRILQFGPFELRTDTGELRKHGIRVKVQAKPLSVLRALLERPGEVVTREELRDRLWSSDTFVDFESGLNTAANRLRIGLGDSADSPRFIETLPRVGYRFIAPVVTVGGASQTGQPESGFAGREVMTPAVSSPGPAAVAPPVPSARKLRISWIGTRSGVIVLSSALVLLLAAGAVLVLRNRSAPRTPVFHQLSFQPSWIGTARFVPGGNTVVYTRHTDEKGRLFVVNTDSPESRPLEFEHSGLEAISPSGELAILTWGNSDFPMDHSVLARVPLNGGSPLVVAHGAFGADFAPDGETLAILKDGGRVIEYGGKAVYRSEGLISAIRISPTGDRIAFLEHPLRDDDAGIVRVVDLAGNARTLTRHWASVSGMAWSPSGKEVWFTASEAGIDRSLRAVTLDGRDRLMFSAPGVLRLLDVSRNGRVLLARDDRQTTMAGELAGDKEEQDLSWFDFTMAEDISADGNLVVFTEGGEASGAHYWAYVHNRSTNATTRIGVGRAMALSPDSTHVLTYDPANPRSLSLLPLADGPQVHVQGNGFVYQWAQFFPNGRDLLVGGSYPGQPLGLFRQAIAGGKPEPLRTGGTYLDFDFIAFAPDGVHLAGLTPAGMCEIVALGSDQTQSCGTNSSLVPVRWAADGKHLYMVNAVSNPLRMVLADPVGGHTQQVRILGAGNPGGLRWLARAVVTPDGQYFAYSLQRMTSQMFVVDGLG